MGLASSQDKYIGEIIEMSQKCPHKLKESDIQEIIMNSQFKEKELRKLYEKFLQLDEDNQGMLTNIQLLNLPEFKFTPFRTRLFYALQLKSDEEVIKIRNMQNEDVRLEDLGNVGTEDGRNS